jgi:glutathione S-transferase
MELFWISGSPPSWRVMLALAIKEIDYTSHQLDSTLKEHKSPEYLQLNPRGQVPVLRVDDTIVRESLAIIAYLDRLHPTPPLLGTDPTATGKIWQWLMDFENHLRPAMATIALAIFRNQMESQLEAIASATEIIQIEIQEIAGQLDRQDYLTDRAVSAADITLYPSLQWLRRALTLSKMPKTTQQVVDVLASAEHLLRWERSIETIPGYDKTYPPHWRST